MGRVARFAPEVFNCSAPDTGNMEVLVRYGTGEQKRAWLEPLLAGEIRSCFAMTEPDVASSDATNIQSRIVREGDEYVINGRKWWTSGAGDPRCKSRSSWARPIRARPAPAAVDDSGADGTPRASRLSACSPSSGTTMPRTATRRSFSRTFACRRRTCCSAKDADSKSRKAGSARANSSLHAADRLWPSARWSRCAARVRSRVAFGKPLAEQGTIRADIAESRIEIEQARLLTLQAAHLMDTVGNKARGRDRDDQGCRPRMALRVIDRAIQAHGGAGVSRRLWSGLSLGLRADFQARGRAR